MDSDYLSLLALHDRLTEGALLSPYGFGWFVVAMSVTLYIVAKCLPKFIRLDG